MIAFARASHRPRLAAVAFRFLAASLQLAFFLVFARAEPVPVRFQYWGDTAEIGAINRIAEGFNASHPGIRVKVERAAGYNGYADRILTQLAGGVAPDIVFIEVGLFPRLADPAILRPLNPYIEKTPGLDIKAWYPTLVRRFTRNGQLMVLPRDTAPMNVVYFNKRLFDEAGIKYPDASWSWSPAPSRRDLRDPDRDFLSVAKRLTNRVNGRNERWGFATNGTWVPFVYTLGGRLADSEPEPTRLLLTDPRVLQGIGFQAAMMNRWHVMPTPVDVQGASTSAMDLFIQGRVAMYLSGIWDTPVLRQIKDFDWDVAPFPAGPTGLRGYDTGGSGYAITAQCRHPEAAWEFVRYAAGAPGQRVLAREGRAQPAIRALAWSPAWMDERKPVHKGQVVNDAPKWAVYSPFTKAWPAIEQAIGSELDRVWRGQVTPAVAMQRAQRQAQKLLDEANSETPLPRLNPWAAGAAIATLVMSILGAVVVAARRDLGPSPTRSQRRETLAGYLAISPWVLGFLLFTAVPLGISLVMAFSRWDLIHPAEWAGLGNFARMATDDAYVPKALSRTLIYTLFAVPLGVAASLALALLLNAGLRGMRFFRTVYYLPAVVSAVASAVLWVWIFNPEFGLLNFAIDKLGLAGLAKAVGLVDARSGRILWLADEKLALPSLILMSLWGAGGSMLIFLAGLQGVPRALYEAAEVDGAGALSRFRNVTLPMMTPTIFFSLILGVIGSFQVFVPALVMTNGGPQNATLFYVLHLYRSAFQNLQMGYASALAWVLFLIVLAITVLQLRFSGWVYYEGGTAR